MPVDKRSSTSRGCLHKLVVQNFKSYAGTLTLGPFKDFTCVIGPNGSGKSNLMDAVSFVVGVNTTQLRGTRLADFRTNLDTATDAPTSVTLYYHGPSHAGDRTPTETLFTRTITARDANEWRVDGRKVDSEEYQRRLKNVGLLVKPRNFLVFQNEVEAVASKSAKQLTELLERICGSEDLKSDYEELQEKKSEAAQVSVAVYKRSLLVSHERKLLKDQVKEATTYQELQDKLQNLKIRRCLFDLFHIERQLASFADEADGHAARLNGCEANCKAIGKGFDKKNREKSAKDKEWAVFDKKIQDLEKQIKRIETRDVLKIDEYLEGKKRQQVLLEKEIKTIQEKAQDSRKKINPQEKSCKELEALQAQEKAKHESRDFQASGLQVSKYNTLKQKALSNTHKAKAALEKTERENNTHQLQLSKLDGEISHYKNRIESLSEKQKESQDDKIKHDKESAEATASDHKVKSDLKDVEKDLSEWSAQLKVLAEKANEVTTQLSDARVDERFAKSEDEKRKVVDYLCQSFPGVRGRVLDLCKVKQRQHELAITVVMEGNMDSIVVEREETAKRCVEYLREQRHKPMTFLPLDSIKASPPDERLRMIPGAKLALDLVDFDRRDEKVMWHVTGNTVVVNTLDEAKRLAFGSSSPKCKIVTLDAAVISRSGAMTGGDTSHLTNKAQRWQNQEFDRLKEKADANMKEQASLMNKIELAKKKKSALEREGNHLMHQLTIFKNRKTEVERSLSLSKKEFDVLKNQLAEKERSRMDVRSKMDELSEQLRKEREELEGINDDVYRNFCAELKISHISEFEGGSFKEHKEHTDKMMELTSQILRQKAAIQKLKDQEKAAEEQERIKKEELDRIKKEIEGHKTEKQSKEKEIREAKDERAAEEEKRRRIKKELDELDKELKDIQVALKKTQDDRDEVLRLVERAESKMESLRSQRKNIIEQCTIDEISLPKKGAGRDSTAGDGDEDRDEMDVDGGSCSHSQSAMQAKEEIAKDRFDYSRLPRDQRRELADKDQSKIRGQVEEEQSKVSEIINSMNPNMKAMDQLKEVEIRYTAVLEESKAAKENSQSLSKSFEEVKQKRCDLFNSCFEHVKGCIDVVYKELTSDPTRMEQSVGGSAYLTLNNQDEPYLDGIKYDTIPPGKRFMDMAHLSGGEKTVAALALLFAINSYAPAPFIVLDEVDAALDARNVAKVTRYIQARRKEQQCVIISLKERFYEKADALVGICRDISGGHSRVFTLDLTVYEASG